MNLLIKIQICLLFGVILLNFAASPAYSAGAKYYSSKKDSKQLKLTDYYNRTISIRLNSTLPESLKEQRIAAFKALRPVLTGNISKASVIWQSDDFSFGKKASISKIYISDFLNKKISEEKFIEHINLEMIEPLSIRKSFVESANIPEVSQENLIVSLKLRDKADLYRIDGNLESALRIYNQIINLNPGDYISLYWIGEIYKNQNKIDLAKEYFTKALSFSHDFKSADDALFEIILKDNSFSW